MKRVKYIYSVLGLNGTIAELILVAIYGCFTYAVGDLTIAYIENREMTGVSVGEFAFTIGIFIAGAFSMLFIGRFIWEYKRYKSHE